VQLLQAQFLHRGQDQERTIWWGRDYGSFQVYQWMVEDATNEWQQEFESDTEESVREWKRVKP